MLSIRLYHSLFVIFLWEPVSETKVFPTSLTHKECMKSGASGLAERDITLSGCLTWLWMQIGLYAKHSQLWKVFHALEISQEVWVLYFYIQQMHMRKIPITLSFSFSFFCFSLHRIVNTNEQAKVISVHTLVKVSITFLTKSLFWHFIGM